jgi:hypothetical protein
MSDLDRQLLAWAASVLQQSQIDKDYCKITFHIENGRIVRSNKDTSIIPPEAGVLRKQTNS